MAAVIRIAVVGVGLIGKRHCQHVLEEAETSLVALVEPTSAAVDLAKQYNIPCYTSLSQLLQSDIDLDAVIIATPTHLHVDMASHVLKAGKYVLVEKPMTGDAVSARRLVEADKVAGGKVLASLTFCDLFCQI